MSSRLRVTTGDLRGRVLRTTVPRGVRPTSARVREALFNLLGSIEGLSFLDAAGGSGIVALEAYSRGAGPVVILERDGKSLATIRKNLTDLSLSGAVRVVRTDAKRWRAQPDRFDWVFVDPPYAAELDPWLRALCPLALSGLVLEHRVGAEFEIPEGYRRDDSRQYGDTALTFISAAGEG